MSAVGTFKTLYVPETWADETPTPFWASEVAGLVQRTRDWYALESYGRLTLDSDINPLARTPISSTVSGYPQSVSAPGYDRIVYLTSRNVAAGFKGRNWGRESWVNCMGSDYALHSCIHELGHSIGLGHPLVLRIGSLQGSLWTLPPLTETTGGSTQDLYDLTTAMGYEAINSAFSGPQEKQLGWITSLLYVGGDKTLTLTALGVPGGSLYLVEIPGNAWRAASQRVYWLEYRIDAANENGVVLHTMGDFGCTTYARVNDALLAGQSFTDGTITVDVLTTGPTKATLRLRDTALALPPPDEWDALITRMRGLETSLEAK